MANHLEDLVAEWLELNGWFVRKSVLVGRRPNGGFEGELDVVGFHPATKRLLHVECSLDADRWDIRETRFAGKFERGRRYIRPIFDGIEIEGEPDQVALLQFGGGERTTLAGGRIVWVRDLVNDIVAKLAKMPPDKKAVPSTLPLLRSMQLAAQPRRARTLGSSLISTALNGEMPEESI